MISEKEFQCNKILNKFFPKDISNIINYYKKKLENQVYTIYNIGYTENYSIIKPIYIEENIQTKVINFFFDLKLNKFYLPNFQKFKKDIFKNPPDIIIMRPYNKLFTLYLV